MVKLEIRIQSVEDARQGIALFPGVEPKNFIEGNLTACIQEGGTVSGQTTLLFGVNLPGGQIAYGQMTARHFETLIAAYRGAQERFGQPVDYVPPR